MGITKVIKKTEDQFYREFTPLKNHYYDNPEDCSFDGCMYETYGQEVQYIEAIACGELARKQIWTIIEAEGKMYIVSGFKFVNRIGYLVTDEFVPEGFEYEVELEGVPENEPQTRPNYADFVTEVTVVDPDSKGDVQLSVFKHQNGGMFAIDSSFIEQVIGGDDDTDKVVISDPMENGWKVELRGI